MEQQLNLLSSAEAITIKKVRGKYVISTMPDSLVFAKENTILECQKCMDNASWKGVLIGSCDDCGYIYYECCLGFPEKENKEDMPISSYAAPFGFYSGFAEEVCRQIDAILFNNNAEDDEYDFSLIPPNPMAINHADAYSFYGMASLYRFEAHLLMESPYSNLYECYYCLGEDDVRWTAISHVLDELSSAFDPHSRDFFNKCEKLEHEWKICKTATSQKEVNSEMAVRNNKVERRYVCSYCGLVGNRDIIKRCAGCKSVQYCSVACQMRDWTRGTPINSSSFPHKQNCFHLKSLRAAQEKYDKMMREARDERDELELVAEQLTEQHIEELD